MDATEKCLAKRWFQEDGMSQGEVARLLKRSKGTIHKFCAAEGLFGMAAGPKKKQKGHPLAIAPEMYTKLKHRPRTSGLNVGNHRVFQSPRTLQH